MTINTRQEPVTVAGYAPKGNGGFWRSSQQEVFDQFDRLLER
jgi:hypothetical protein